MRRSILSLLLAVLAIVASGCNIAGQPCGLLNVSACDPPPQTCNQGNGGGDYGSGDYVAGDREGLRAQVLEHQRITGASSAPAHTPPAPAATTSATSRRMFGSDE